MTARCSQARPRGRPGRTTATTAPITASPIASRHSSTVGTGMCPVAILPTMKPDAHSGTNSTLISGTTQRPVGAVGWRTAPVEEHASSATHC